MSAITIKDDGTIVVTTRITLKPERDQELIDSILAAPKRRRATIIRELMRTGIDEKKQVEKIEEDLDLSNLIIKL